MATSRYERNKAIADQRSEAEKHCQKLACRLGACASKNVYNQSKCAGLAKEYQACIQGFLASRTASDPAPGDGGGGGGAAAAPK